MDALKAEIARKRKAIETADVAVVSFLHSSRENCLSSMSYALWLRSLPRTLVPDSNITREGISTLNWPRNTGKNISLSRRRKVDHPGMIRHLYVITETSALVLMNSRSEAQRID